MTDEESVKERLEDLMKQVMAILDISDRSAPPEFNIEESRALFCRFKDHVRKEYYRTDKGNLSDAEQTWYRPAVQEIWAKALLSSARQDAPLEKLRQVLSNAEDIVRGHLKNLESAVEND